ncbi:Rpn family recombination-promoting nuclease/putative transposase [Fibrisoma montanum]|uniref:Rpn family recombination-promoting nuclease/putative transposase n=1 Tax=Fibrisoma montanum TaxID=2305895 RepID=UPI0035B5FEF3
MDNPHDKFFKETFSRPTILTDFLQAYLPIEISEAINTSSLRREADSHTDEALSEHFANLVFSATYCTVPIKTTLLFEHKSYPESYVHFQLNQYLLNIWQH